MILTLILIAAGSFVAGALIGGFAMWWTMEVEPEGSGGPGSRR